MLVGPAHRTLSPMPIRPAIALFASLLLPALSQAQAHWPGFRGPDASGIAPGPAPPASFDRASGEGVLWEVPVPGLAHSGAAIWGDRLFLTSAVRIEGESELSSLFGSANYGSGDSVPDEGPHAFQVLCFDRHSGEQLWSADAHRGVPRTMRHPKSTHANSTPACDAERVVGFFGS